MNKTIARLLAKRISKSAADMATTQKTIVGSMPVPKELKKK